MAAKKKSTAKKATKVASKGKKTTAKKATATKATASKATARTGSRKSFDKVNKPRTKSQILGAISEATGLAKKEVSQVIDSLGELIGHDLTSGPGKFTVPGLMKVTVIRKPATKARKGTNPFTGEEMMFKAKPARNVVKIRPLKALKDKV